jgi:hypothetical protein
MGMGMLNRNGTDDRCDSQGVDGTSGVVCKAIVVQTTSHTAAEKPHVFRNDLAVSTANRCSVPRYLGVRVM